MQSPCKEIRWQWQAWPMWDHWLDYDSESSAKIEYAFTHDFQTLTLEVQKDVRVKISFTEMTQETDKAKRKIQRIAILASSEDLGPDTDTDLAFACALFVRRTSVNGLTIVQTAVVGPRERAQTDIYSSLAVVLTTTLTLKD